MDGRRAATAAMTEPLRTPRLTGRPFRRADWPILAAILTDPALGRWLTGSAPLEPAAAEARARRGAERFAESWAAEGAGPYLWTLGARPVAYAGLRAAMLDGAPCWEALWGVAPAATGRGYATEAAAAAIAQDGDAASPDAPLLAWTLPGNRASRRVMAKLDFELIGETEVAGLRHLVHRRALNAGPPAPAARS